MSRMSHGQLVVKGALAVCLVLGVSSQVRAQTATTTPHPEAPTVSPGTPRSFHRLSAYIESGAMVYLSDARTMGGLGAGLGVRDVLGGRFVLQADLSYLGYLGNAAAVQLGAGIQTGGTYNPAALLTLTTLMGDRLSFLTAQHATPVWGPAVTLGVRVAPARFDLGATQVSLFELGVGVGTDLPGLGLCYSVHLLEVGASF